MWKGIYREAKVEYRYCLRQNVYLDNFKTFTQGFGSASFSCGFGSRVRKFAVADPDSDPVREKFADPGTDLGLNFYH